MKKLSFFSAIFVSASVTLSSFASAAPVLERSLLSSTQMTPANVEPVQYDRRHRPHAKRHYKRSHRPKAQRRHHRPGYYRGHHGSRHKRPGYRRHNDGWWYPMAAFTAGAIIGGAVAQPPAPQYRPSHNYSRAHYNWCQAQYRSYRASDNSFQPYNAPRKACISPYM